MRVKINLSSYFKDYRSSSMLFVDEKMKHVKDLEKLISSMFNIHNFYLKCSDCFLPSTVSIRILNEEDVILVCPFEDIEQPSSSTSKKEKRKNKYPQEESFSDNEEVEQSSLSISTKKRNRKRCSKANEDSVIVESPKKQKLDDDFVLEPSIKKKKVKKNKTSEDSFLEQDEQDASEDCNDNFSNLERKDGSSNVKILVDSFEKKQLNLIQHPARSVNIVKTIIVSNSNSTPKVDSLRDETISPKISPINLNKTTSTNQHEDYSKTDANDRINEEVVDEGLFEKPKRKRVRKRKRKAKSPEPTVDQPTIPLIPRPLIIKASSNSHVRFNVEEHNNINEVSTRPNSPQTLQPLYNNFSTTNDTTNVVKTTELEKPNIVKNNTLLKNSLLEREINSTISENLDNNTIKENGDKDPINPKENFPNNVGKTEMECDSCSLSEEFIAKQPDIPWNKPTLGDIVAFKVLRMNDNYTPEISSYIVGKVTNCSSDTKEINFDIIFGQDQCQEPHGKFFLDNEPEEEKMETTETLQQTYNLTDLFSSKLLFP